MNHTKEPWMLAIDPVYGRHLNITTKQRIDYQLCCIAQVELDWDKEFEFQQENNARRIVKCVNAMAEVHDNYIDAVIEEGGAAKFFKERDAYRDLCVELNGVLLATKSFMQAGVEPSLKDIKNAITKAKQLLGAEK